MTETSKAQQEEPHEPKPHEPNRKMVDEPVQPSEEEQKRIDLILKEAQERHVIKRAVHTVTGHPEEQVHWGSVDEGATCSCGAHWTNADMRV